MSDNTIIPITVTCECGFTHTHDVYRLYNLPLCEEKRLLNEEYELQSGMSSSGWSAFLTLDGLLTYLARAHGITEDFIQEWTENIFYMYKGLSKARDFEDVYLVVVAMTKFITKKSYASQLQRLIERVVDMFTPQSLDTSLFQRMLNAYKEVRESPIIDKVRQLIVLGFASSIFSACGLDVALENFRSVYGEALKSLVSSTDFIAHALELAVYVIERLIQCVTTRSLSPFYHSSRTYAAWANDAYSLIEKAQFLHNPSANGFNFHEYLSNLEAAIEKGNDIVKFAGKEDKKGVIPPILSRLRLIRGDILSKKAAGQERRAPFSVLLTGGSGVGKSSLQRLLIHHFAGLFNLPKGSEYYYTRSAQDEYWSNFKTHMWAIILDDIASVNPNKGNEDRSLNDVLQVINNVAYCPPQADVNDKGRTPIRADFVIGTTNTQHLNAHCWFSNPAAVQRRFPYIISVRPKPEYAREDAKDMLDGRRVPALDPGSYPDVWLIEFKKVTVATDKTGKQFTKIEAIGAYGNIYEFMDEFSRVALEFRAAQDHFTAFEETLDKIELCICHRPKKHCACKRDDLEAQSKITMEEALEIYNRSNVVATVYEDDIRNVWTPLDQATSHGDEEEKEDENSTLREKVYAGATAAACAAPRAYRTAKQAVLNCTRAAVNKVRIYARDYAVKYMKNLGSNIVLTITGNKKLHMILKVLGGIALAYGAYKLYGHLTKEEFEKHAESGEGPSVSNFGQRVPPTGDERENFYYQKGDYVANLVTTERTHSWRSLQFTDVCRKISDGVVAISSVVEKGENRRVHTNAIAVCVGGNLYVTDAHALPKECAWMKFQREVNKGVSTNVVRKFDPKMVYRIGELAFFQLFDAFACKNLQPLMAKRGFKCKSDGALIVREQMGGYVRMTTKCISYRGKESVPQLEDNPVLGLWDYTLSEHTTYSGLCGAPLVMNSPSGPVIVALHLLGVTGGHSARGVTICYEDVEEALKHFRPSFEPAPPMLESQSGSVGVTRLHDKSVFRYFNESVGKVYGSLTCARVQPKTNVCPTIMREAAVKRGFKVNTFAPVMRGWKPWRNAVGPILEQAFLFEESIVKECAEAYTNEVWRDLPDQFKSELAVPLDLFTAINGVPGRKYVDSINRSTSAGFPWCKTKKHVTVKLEAEGLWTDPIDVIDEVKERMEVMYKRYMSGQLVAPIFIAHLKDEPLPERKIKSEKTRVMNGAPLDWSLLVRMAYLPAVRVIQMNKFLFEAAPGAVAQSIEWTDFYHYITKYGKDRIIAGDYGNFDKKMSSVFIMYAFQIIIDLTERAGGSAEHIKLMWGIAYDTATSFCNYNGDLVQFLGSNPSGHPLTVIINCLVNSLYMRYCYRVLNPKQEVATFRKNVSLMTYGDDNIMSSKVDWFNHCAIAETLHAHGVTYTMADKEAESRPFVDISEASFLKRGWRYETELDAYMCPIDHATLDKMMTTWIPSKVQGTYAHAEEILRNVGTEYFWYGKEIFEEKQVILKEIATEVIPEEYITPNTFPSWEYLKNMWRRSSDLPTDEDENSSETEDE